MPYEDYTRILKNKPPPIGKVCQSHIRSQMINIARFVMQYFNIYSYAPTIKDTFGQQVWLKL